MPADALAARTPEEVRAEIARRRAQLSSSSIALQAHVDALTDWRHWVRESPWLLVGSAFALGFALAHRGR